LLVSPKSVASPLNPNYESRGDLRLAVALRFSLLLPVLVAGVFKSRVTITIISAVSTPPLPL